MDNVEYQAAETFSIVLSRPDQSISWGFRLQGGFDFSTPLSIQVVQPNSIAESCGLLAGDGILQINNTNADGLTHENAKMEIIRSGNDISLVVQRGAVKIWKPKVTPLSDLRPEELKPIKTATGEEIVAVQKTSLAIKQQEEPCNIGSSHNRSARPFQAFASSAAEALPQQYQQQQYQPPPQPQQQYQQQQYQPPPQPQQQYQQQQYQPPSQQPYQQQQQPVPSAGQQFQPQSNIPAPPPPPPLSNKQAVPSVVHAQYNTPISLYSAGNIAETYSAQTQSISEQMQRMDVGQVPSGSKATPSGFVQSPTSPGDFNIDPSHVDNLSFRQLAELLSHSIAANARVPSGFRSVTAPKTDMQAVQQQQQKRESMRCGDCDMLVTGVFVRVKGVPYHAGCFKCTSCSMNLKQKGYFVVDNKLYCEIHAKRVAQSPGADMVAVPVYR